MGKTSATIVFALVLASGGLAAAAPAGKRPAPCAAAANNALRLGLIDAGDVDEFVAACTGDRWDARLIACFRGAKKKQAARKCEQAANALRRAAVPPSREEATTNVRSLWTGVCDYAAAHGGALPGADATAPAPGSCCQNADHRCAPAAAAWAAEPWTALRFDVKTPHRCWYTYDVAPVAEVEGVDVCVRAECDADCDGKVALFEMCGRKAADGTVQGQGAMYRKDADE